MISLLNFPNLTFNNLPKQETWNISVDVHEIDGYM